MLLGSGFSLQMFTWGSSTMLKDFLKASQLEFEEELKYTGCPVSTRDSITAYCFAGFQMRQGEKLNTKSFFSTDFKIKYLELETKLWRDIESAGRGQAEVSGFLIFFYLCEISGVSSPFSDIVMIVSFRGIRYLRILENSAFYKTWSFYKYWASNELLLNKRRVCSCCFI